MTSSAVQPHRDPHRWVVFAIISLVYFFVYFHRVSTSVIASDLLTAFDTTPGALGLMSSMYFYIYALNQPLVGYLADRLGPRRVIAYWSMTAAAGCFLFGLAPSIGWASVGRALIGFGVGGVYVPTVKALSQWFREKEFATMVGLLMSVGNAGAVVATTPLAWAASSWGWRPTFFLIGGISLVLAIVMLFVSRDAPGEELSTTNAGNEADMPSPGVWSRVGTILTSLQFWLIATTFFGVYGTAVTLQGLWATPFLMAALDAGQILASKLNMLIPIGVIVGAPFFGWLPDRLALNKSHALRTIVAMYCLCWLAILPVWGTIGVFGYAAALLLMGVVIGGFISTIWGIIRETTPTHRLGLTSGLLNPAPFFGVAVFQVGTGSMIDRAGYTGDMVPLSSFAPAFGVCLAGAACCLIASCFIRSKPQRQRNE